MPSDSLSFDVMDRIVRAALQKKGLSEPRHYTMTIAVVTGLYLRYPIWMIGTGKTDEEVERDIAVQMSSIADAVAVLDQATPIGAKINPSMN